MRNKTFVNIFETDVCWLDFDVWLQRNSNDSQKSE